MKHYPEISYYGDYWDLPIIAFEKIDGSNLRFEYSHKRGFYKFGTRNQVIDHKSEPFGFAIELFLNKYADNLTQIFRSKEYRNILSFICFAELFAENSEFGQHDFKNGKFDIVLFDINQYKKGIMPPRQFVKDFSLCGIPKIIYEGNLNKTFVELIKENRYNLSEGVVCKGTIPNKKENNLYYCKIKTNDWFERLRNKKPEWYQQELKQADKSLKQYEPEDLYENEDESWLRII